MTRQGTPARRQLCAWNALAAGAAALLAGCVTAPPAATLACNDSIKSAFKPDAQTTVVSVREIKKGAALTAVDSPSPITMAADLCLVKLLIGPGAMAEKDKNARAYSEGIGIEVWLPAQWNERIRNYGDGGWVGGGHRYPDQIGSKVPALVDANMGYASGTADAGQPWYQDPFFAYLSNGQLNLESLHDFTTRAMVEQAVKTKALVTLYYGKSPRFTDYDGHSQGGRKGLKVAQQFPELYDGYMIGQPAISPPMFGTVAIQPQIVMRTELGFTSADKAQAAAFAKKVDAANKRAVVQCHKPGLGFLLNPSSCNYDPLRDAGALCNGVLGDGVTGNNADASSCMSARAANALNKIWYGATSDGSWDATQSADGRAGKSLGAKQPWWTFSRSAAIGGLIAGADTDNLALMLQDVRYAADASTTARPPVVNGSKVFTRTCDG